MAAGSEAAGGSTSWRVLAVALLALAGCGRAPDDERAFPKLVVLVSLDTLRADRLECYGYGRETAPHLAALAREGVRFETVLAQASQTLVSHKSLFAGRYPLALLGDDLEAALEESGDPRALLIDRLRRTDGGLVERLRRAGWRTAAFTDGGWMRAEMGFDRGFEVFDARGGGLEAIVPRAGAWLAQPNERPTLLFVHAYDVHCPYTTREPYDSRFCVDHAAHVTLEGRCAKDDLEREQLSAADWRAIGDHYDGGIASADAWLGQLFALLRARGAWDEALVIVTSDHGESLGEHGLLGHGSLTPQQLLVPLLVKPPASWGIEPRVVETPLELVDLMPGVLEACGVALPEGLDGRSFLPLLVAEDGSGGRRALVAQTVFRTPGTDVADPTARAVLVPGRFFACETSADGFWATHELDPGPLTSEDIELLRSLDFRPGDGAGD